MAKKQDGLTEDYILDKVTIEIKDPDNVVYKLSFKPYGRGATADELKYKQTEEQLKVFCENHGIPLEFTVPAPAMNRVITLKTLKSQMTIEDFKESETEEETEEEEDE